MERYGLKKELVITLTFFVCVLFVFTFNATSSRYRGEIQGRANDVLAVPVIGLENPTFTYTAQNVLPGFTDEADFYVTNYDNTKNNEILMKYYLKIQLNTIIPIKVTLTDANELELPLLEDGKTEEFILPYDKTMRTKFHLKIEWDKKDNSYEYAGKDISLKIDLIATQVVEG